MSKQVLLRIAAHGPGETGGGGEGQGAQQLYLTRTKQAGITAV